MAEEAEITPPTLLPLAARLRGILCTYAARDFPGWWTAAIEEAIEAIERKEQS